MGLAKPISSMAEDSREQLFGATVAMTGRPPLSAAGMTEKFCPRMRTGSRARRRCCAAAALVAFGTETVYGLGADATNAEAVAGIFAAKGRPRFNPLICHYPDADAAFAHVVPNEAAQRLAAALWPGPLTLVLQRRPDCPVALLTGAGLDTLAVRVPAQDTRAGVAARGGAAGGGALGQPVRAGQPDRPPRMCWTELGGRIDAVLDSGPCPVGVESTVLDLSSGAAGAAAAGRRDAGGDRGADRAGGATAPHRTRWRGRPACSPRTTPLPFPSACTRGTCIPTKRCSRSVRRCPARAVAFNLSERGDLTEAAARLFAGLRWLDAEAARHGLDAHRRHAGAGNRARAGDQRPAAARGGAPMTVSGPSPAAPPACQSAVAEF